MVLLFSLLLATSGCPRNYPSKIPTYAVAASIFSLQQLQGKFESLTTDFAPASVDHPVLIHYARVSAAIEFLNQKMAGIDFSKMSIEDAVMMMFMLIAEEAREDMRDMLAEMESDREARTKLRDAATKLKEELDTLEVALKAAWDAMPENPNAPLTITTAIHEIRPVGSADGTPAPAEITLEVAAAGELTSELHCPSGKYKATLALRNLTSDQEIATETGTAELLRASAQFASRTRVRVDTSIFNLPAFQMLACKLWISYPTIKRDTHVLLPQVRWSVAQAIAARDQAARELLKTASTLQAFPNLQRAIAVLVSSRASYSSNAGSFAQLDTVIDALADETSSLAELGAEQQLKMQLFLDRMTKADEALTNALKKFADAENQIIQNLK